jgi:SAM-dependent methyltransferase
MADATFNFGLSHASGERPNCPAAQPLISHYSQSQQKRGYFMSYDYDKLYRDTPNALGDPTRDFVDFFAATDLTNMRVLDIGCGQGRDALFIARLGHRVVGVDLSPAGIADLVKNAQSEGLPIDGVVADIATYVPEGIFDIVLIDRTLHMLDEEPRNAALARFLGHVGPTGYVLIADERSNMAAFRAVIAADSADWDAVRDTGATLFLQRRY